MSKEENKKAYKALDFKVINEKKADCMLEIVKSKNPKDAAAELFDFIKEKFTHDELAYFTCVHIALLVKESLEKNPKVRMLIQMLRMSEELASEDKDVKENDIMEMVKNILKN